MRQLQLFRRVKVKAFMIPAYLLTEICASLITVVVVTAIVAIIFPFICRREKRKGNLRVGEIIKNLLKKLV